jgi:3-deoxy-D-manno-octulosonic-acid transferase
MARSLGLTAYRTLAARREDARFVPASPRPDGPLVWLHAAEPGSLAAMRDLARRLEEARADLNVLITLPRDSTIISKVKGGDMLGDVLPTENPNAVTLFLDHWHPDACVWGWGDLQPNLILEAASRNIPSLLIDADASGFDKRRDRWLPDLTRRVLRSFGAVFVRSEDGYQRFLKTGVPRSVLQKTPPLMGIGEVLACAESDLSEMSQALSGRPVWFANKVMLEELDAVLAAHRDAMRLSHRLLLIIDPADHAEFDEFAARISDQKITVFQWPDGGYPDTSVHVMLAQEPGDSGLFYRIAPVSFLGSSLVAGGQACDPFEAANLGSAILYGPRVGQSVNSYSILAERGAARIVKDGQTLGNAVSRLISPEQAAAMAHAGWDVISQGAESIDQIIEHTLDRMQTAGPSA